MTGYPILDEVVTVHACHYYLSLINRFTETTKNMTEQQLRIYLVRAEDRYIGWIKNIRKMQSHNIIPPIDVAYLWHTHMLSPFRYYEDLTRLRLGDAVRIRIPLKAMYDHRMEPHKHSLELWPILMGPQPYDLDVDNLDGDKYVECLDCHKKMKSK
ncbi:hypothetical protein EC973_007879, partial [Apophysomyces ossiformis]